MRLVLKFSQILLLCLPAAAQAPHTVDEILTAYVQALGGPKAIESIQTRVVKGSLGLRLSERAELYWAKPNKVLRIEGKAKTGFDGSSGWTYSKRKKVHRLGKGGELPLEIDANPLRYAALKQMYSELSIQAAKSADDKEMDILAAPNSLAQTTFYFDSRTHLLARIEEKGETSAYFTNTIEFLDYKRVDGVQFPFNIVHRTSLKGGEGEDFHVKQVKCNVELNPEIFSKPQASVVVLGGKR